MGCGRVGSALALAMQRRGHSTVVIDRDPSALRRLGDDFAGRTVVGVGFDREVLLEAGIESAEAFAAVSSGDNSNIIAARVARETFGVPRVVARIYDAKRAEVFERLGVPTVATVPWTTERFVSALGESTGTALWRDPGGNVALVELDVHEAWIGVPVVRFQELTGARVAFLDRMGRPVLPEQRTVLQVDDLVYAAAVADRLDEVRRAAAVPPLADEDGDHR